MKVFLASSRESLNDMHKIAFFLEALGCDTLTWDSPDAFLPGTYMLGVIIDVSRAVDAAIFIFAEDDRVWYRSSELHQPRDNVLVEYGLFAGILGPERALICRKGRPRTPSDLEGIVHIDISDDRIESARARIEAWIRRLQQRRGLDSQPLFAQEFVRIVTDDRQTLHTEYRDRKYSAQRVDILSMALIGALDELATDGDHKLLDRVLFHNAQVRMMFVTPTSEYVRQRAIEDGEPSEQLQMRLRGAVRRAVEIYERLKARHGAAEREGRIRATAVGSLEIRVTDFCPHFTIYRTDDSILWGIYTSASKGLYSSVLQVQRSHGALFEQIGKHFDCLWQLHRLGRAAEDSYLVKCHSQLAPCLNEQFVDEILGGSWRDGVTG